MSSLCALLKCRSRTKDNSTGVLQGQVVLVPTEASRAPREELEIYIDASDDQGLAGYKV